MCVCVPHSAPVQGLILSFVASQFLPILCVENQASGSDINSLPLVRMHVTYLKSWTGIVDQELLKFTLQSVITGRLRKVTLTLPSLVRRLTAIDFKELLYLLFFLFFVLL